jgi:hypothetical protein
MKMLSRDMGRQHLIGFFSIVSRHVAQRRARGFSFIVQIPLK